MKQQDFFRHTSKAIADYLYQELRIYPGQHYRVKTVMNGPRVLNLLLTINPSHARRVLAMGEALSMAAGLDKDKRIRIGRGDGGLLALEVPKPKGLWFDIGLNRLPQRRGVKTVVGIDTAHSPAWLDFAQPTGAHCLVAGMTGAGKTNAQRVIVYDLALQNEPAELQFLFCDVSPKQGLGWRPFVNLPHLAHPLITDSQEAYRLFGWLHADIKRRADTGIFTPRLFVGIDELQELTGKSKELAASVETVAAVGREVGVHLLAATQNPVEANLGSVGIKRNMARLVGLVDSPTAAQAAAGIAGSGAELLTGPGDMLLVGAGSVRRVAVALLGESDLTRLPVAESIPTLPLDEFEDLDQVSKQAGLTSGRKNDDLEPEHVAYALTRPEASQRELNRQFGIGFTKIRRIQDFAGALLAALRADGYDVLKLSEGSSIDG